MSVGLRQSRTDSPTFQAWWGTQERHPPQSRTKIRPRIRRSQIQEILSGAITRVEGFPNVCKIDANTSSGLRKFVIALELPAGDVQSDGAPPDIVWDRAKLAELASFLTAVARWGGDDANLFSRWWRVRNAEEPEPNPSAGSVEDTEPELTPADYVRKLCDAGLNENEKRMLVTQVETLDVTGEQASLLTRTLRQFIDDRRESNVPADLVAVASAIRKFVATASTQEAFDYAASLLSASGRSPLPIELELEITKMVVRKLAANPPASNESLPDLAARLNELSETYLNPRLLAREKHGALALNAVIGLVLTRDRLGSRVICRVRDLRVAWFQQLVRRRASRLKAELEERSSDDRYRDLLRSLDELSASVPENTSG